MAEIWGAVAGGIIAAGGAYLSSQGAKKAASTAAGGSDAAAAEAARQFDITRGDVLGRINIGNQAVNALGSMYGYSPNAGSPYQVNPTTYGATPYQAQPIAPSGFGNSGTSSLLNPATVSSKLGGAGKILDPAFGVFGNVFGGGHGDEKRNLQAFAAESGVQQLPNGMLMLPDGSTFSQGQLKDVAGTWYGAVHAPDGNQQDWQNRYTSLLGTLQKTPGIGQQAPAAGNAGGGLTSDGVPNSAPLGPAGAGTNPLAAPDYSAFFKSPDYQFRKDQGMQGIENSFSASGGAKSGNALKALADFNSNLASGEFGNYFNRQLALAGQGQAATTTSSNAGVATGQIVGNALQNSADARASGVAGQYNALGAAASGLSQGLGYYMQQRKNPYYGGYQGPYGYGVPS